MTNKINNNKNNNKYNKNRRKRINQYNKNYKYNNKNQYYKKYNKNNKNKNNSNKNNNDDNILIKKNNYNNTLIKKNNKGVNQYKVKYKSKKSDNYLLTLFIVLISIFIILLGIIYLSENLDNSNIQSIISTKENKINYLDYYYPISITKKDKKIYRLDNNNFIEIGTISSNTFVSLDKDEYINKGYYKIKDTDYYLDYKDLKESNEEIKEDLSWKNYIPYNESIETKDVTNLYLDDKLIYSFKESLLLPIIIKEDNYYGVVFKDKLYYVLKDEVNVIKNNNTDLKHTNGFSALVYHATYDHTNEKEKVRCLNANSTICLSDIEFDKQMKYLKDKGYYTATMKDVEMFIDGKIQLPEKTTVITIDDGYFLDAAVKVLEKYELHGTLFLIGALADLDEWKTDSFYSKSIELHSHTYNKHTPNRCSGGQGSILKCGNKEELLEDLKKSREQLNGSTVFCYPFFEYNDYAINVLKEAGFTMAFAGGRQKIKVGSNKMKLPRYGIINTSTLDDFIRIVN